MKMYRPLVLFFFIMLLHITVIFSAVFIQSPENPFTDKEHSLQFEGRTRTYIVHIPQPFKEGPVPLLFCLHGGGGTAKGMISLTYGRFNKLSDSEGFIVVYPNAVEKNWNDGRLDKEAKSTKENINDVGFIAAIIDELSKKYSIDKSKIFSCGISNGGFMSCRLACDKSEIFSGVGILTATMGVDYYTKCNPSKPVKVIIFNGTEDPLVPYNGGNIMLFNKSRGKCISTDSLIDFWRIKNNCDISPSKITFPDKDPADGTTVEKFTYTGCKDNSSLVLFRITGGGHTWPGGKQYLGKKIIGNTCNDINACDEMWNFFINIK